MSEKARQIQDRIRKFDGIRIREEFRVIKDRIIKGSIEVLLPNEVLLFKVLILPFYPLQFHGHESIRFLNDALKPFNHVNPDGSVCIHTNHSSDLFQKLELDFSGLKYWIDTYYLGDKQDAHYEHIFIPADPGRRDVFLFTDTEHPFKKGEYGIVNYKILNQNGNSEGRLTNTFLVQNFKIGKLAFLCQWSKPYMRQPDGVGIFCFVEDAPVENRRFAYKSWVEFTVHFEQRFLQWLREMVKNIKPQTANIPLLIGYRLPSGEIHWQAAWIHPLNLPMEGVKNKVTIQWESRLLPINIEWCETQNCSYHLFFGRGLFCPRLTDAKVLIIGMGAIGSIIATTLARGGCRRIAIVDYDTKEPGNVCRSEYAFISGIGDKINELRSRMHHISPFVEVDADLAITEQLKSFYEQSPEFFALIKEWLNTYDIVIDCSTDNDLAYMLSKASPDVLLLNISITNHAKELVCTTLPNAYEWMTDIFQKLDNNTTDMYNPTGCWSPTFRASYNDIAVLVQYALKHINTTLVKGDSIRNFYLSTSSEHDFAIKPHLY